MRLVPSYTIRKLRRFAERRLRVTPWLSAIWRQHCRTAKPLTWSRRHVVGRHRTSQSVRLASALSRLCPLPFRLLTTINMKVVAIQR